MTALYLTAQEAGRILCVGAAAVRQMERLGTLKAAAKTEGGIRLFSRVEVEAFAKARARKRVAHGT